MFSSGAGGGLAGDDADLAEVALRLAVALGNDDGLFGLLHFQGGIVVGLLVQAQVADLADAARQDGRGLGDQVLPDLAATVSGWALTPTECGPAACFAVRSFRDLWAVA